MATPSPTFSPPSDSSPYSAATPPQKNPPPSSAPQPLNFLMTLASAARKTQPVLWTQDETLLLIESYKDKWRAAGRGPLKSSHWEEIAVAVSVSSRSATQCRHKMEKLRKRFRAERQSVGPISTWPFYSQMGELDSSPAPISARPLTRLPPSSSHSEEEDERQSKSRSINYIVRRPGTVNRFVGGSGGEERRRRRRRKGARAVASEIRCFGERVMVIEKKMEFAEETVKMEFKRVKLIQSSQAQLLQSLNIVFGSF